MALIENQAPGFICSLCLYDDREHDAEWDETLTVVNGQLVCVQHVNYASGTVDHSSAVRAVRSDATR